MKSKLVRQKEEETHDAPALDIEEVLRERYNNDAPNPSLVSAQKFAPKTGSNSGKSQIAAAKPSSQKSAPPPPRTVQTKTARVAGAGATGRKRNVIRVSVDFPVNLYETVVSASNEQEQTIREFILTLVRQHFNN